MEHSTAQRRLVKSPPEPWARDTGEDAPARRLRCGEIRITRLEPETTVAWEGDRASGTVELEPAGWGRRRPARVTGQILGEPLDDPGAAHHRPFSRD